MKGKHFPSFPYSLAVLHIYSKSLDSKFKEYQTDKTSNTQVLEDMLLQPPIPIETQCSIT